MKFFWCRGLSARFRDRGGYSSEGLAVVAVVEKKIRLLRFGLLVVVLVPVFLNFSFRVGLEFCTLAEEDFCALLSVGSLPFLRIVQFFEFLAGHLRPLLSVSYHSLPDPHIEVWRPIAVRNCVCSVFSTLSCPFSRCHCTEEKLRSRA